MSEIQWNLGHTDPIGEQARAFSYADQVRQNAAKYQAGNQYASGDYAGAAQTQAQAGDIPQAQQTQQYATQTAAKGQQYIAQALPVFAKIAEAHAGDPDKGAAAIGDAFDHIAPEAQALTGANPQALAALRNSLVSDPQGTITRMWSQIPTEYKTAGESLFAFKNGQPVGQYQGQKTTILPQGAQAIQTGGGGNMLAPGSSGSQTPGNAAPAAPGGSSPAPSSQLIARADPSAMHVVESGNNPAAVSPVGAVGVSQTMPATLQSPGYGVSPARDNSPQEQQRVGDEYLGALNSHYGNPVLAHIAYNWGPGNTDKWLAAGGDFSKLPQETQQYLGRIAVAQTVPQGGGQGSQQQGNAPRVIASNAVPVNSEAIKNDVRIWLASKGTINPQYGMGAIGATNRQAFDTEKNNIMKELGVTPEDVSSGQAIRKADMQSLVALQKQADSIKAFEGTASKNADLALSLLDKGGPQGQAPLLNKWTQEYRKWITGDKNVSQYTLSLGTFADEYAKVVAGQNGATDAVRAEAYNRINGAMNKGTIRAVIETMKQEMANRSAANDEQLSTIRQRLGQAAPAQGGDQAKVSLAPGTKYKGLDVLSPTAAMKLKPGMGFYDTSGVFRVRK